MTLQKGRELLQLLLGAEVVAVSASLLTAVVSTRGKTRVALAANHLLAVVLLGEGGEGGLDHTTSHLEEHFKSGLSSNAVGTDSLRVLEFLASENQALVLVVDVFLLLEHLLHVLHGFRGLDLKRDGVSLDDGECPNSAQNDSIPRQDNALTVTVLTKICILLQRTHECHFMKSHTMYSR